MIARVRRSEWVLWAFLVYIAGMAASLPVSANTRIGIVALNATVLAAYVLVITSEAASSRVFTDMARDWLPLLLVLLTYHEMGALTLPQATHSFEARLVVWDQAVLRGGAKAVIESLGPVIPAILELAYLLVYALGPFSIAMLYVYRRRDRVDRFLFLFLLAIFLCYAQFPFWPSEPPRVVFPTQDLPGYMTVFRSWNLWLLRVGAIQTSVFPSGHVAAACAAAAGMLLYLPEHKWVGRSLVIVAGLIAAATVYGRYHYSADAAAGLLMAGVALLVTCLA